MRRRSGVSSNLRMLEAQSSVGARSVSVSLAGLPVGDGPFVGASNADRALPWTWKNIAFMLDWSHSVLESNPLNLTDLYAATYFRGTTGRQ